MMIRSSSPRPISSGLQAIVFDLDDTLYPERAYVLSGFKAVAKWAEDHLGIPEKEGYANLSGLFEAGVRGDTFNRWLSSHGLQLNDLLEPLIHVYRDHEPHLAPFPEVPAILEWLHRSCLIGLVSDGFLSVQQRKWKALGMAGYFDAVVFSDEWGRAAWKPSTRPFEEVLRKLGSHPTMTPYIGDNPAKDFLGARRAGMPAIRIRRPGGEYYHLEPATREHAPDYTITSLDELRQLIEEIP